MYRANAAAPAPDTEPATTPSAPPRFATKALEWVKRYAPSEVLGLAAALTTYTLGRSRGVDPVLLAFLAAWSETITFYAVIVVRQLRADRRAARLAQQPYRALHTLSRLVLEFGPAEFFDSAVVRPVALWSLPQLLPGVAGVVAGKLCADIAFYVPAIISYEVAKKHVETSDNKAAP
jgi:hypothetical protein